MDWRHCLATCQGIARGRADPISSLAQVARRSHTWSLGEHPGLVHDPSGPSFKNYGSEESKLPMAFCCNGTVRFRPNADIHDTTVNFHPRGHARQGSLGGNAGTDGVASWLRNRLTTTVQTPVPRSVHGLHRWRMPFQSTLSFHRSL